MEKLRQRNRSKSLRKPYSRWSANSLAGHGTSLQIEGLEQRVMLSVSPLAAVAGPVPGSTADLQVSTTAPTPSPGITGQVYTYTSTTLNAGPQPATNVVMTETVPGGPGSGQVITGINILNKTGNEVITQISSTQWTVGFGTVASG